MKTNQRLFKNFFPEPKFQGRFILVLLISCLLPLSILGGIWYHFLDENYKLLIQYGALDPEVEALLRAEFQKIVVIARVLSIGFILLVLLIGTLFSHRIAGPVYALKRTLKDVLSGKETRLQLRKFDEFREVEEGFNQLIDRLKKAKA
jgi:methyl-accepting chemotaxis protein